MQVALIGYGEVGRILAEDLRARGTAVVAFDILAAAASPASASDAHATRRSTASRWPIRMRPPLARAAW